MATRNPYRHHAPEFKQQLCADIRAARISRREAQRKYSLSANLIQRWLQQFDGARTVAAPAAAPTDHAACDARIAALERKVGQLTMEIDRLHEARLEALREMDALGGAASPPPPFGTVPP